MFNRLKNCPLLKTVTYPPCMNEIHIFYADCPSLTDIYLPDTVTLLYGAGTSSDFDDALEATYHYHSETYAGFDEMYDALYGKES